MGNRVFWHLLITDNRLTAVTNLTLHLNVVILLIIKRPIKLSTQEK